MVNGWLPKSAADVARRRGAGETEAERIWNMHAPALAACRFAQILDKFYFLDLAENSQRILLDYEPKCPCPANAAFNGA